MTGMIPNRAAKLAVAILAAAVFMAVAAGAASASTEVVYNNTNTVPATVTSSLGTFPNEDTFSEGFSCCGNHTIGGEIKVAGTAKTIKSMTVQVDSFRCEEGEYNLENCRSRPGKKFHQAFSVKVYEVTGTHERGPLIAEASTSSKIPFRPTTNVTCPATGEGKGFGSNCDVGGYLATVKFKHFSYNVLPNSGLAIVEFATPSEGDVNIGLEESYKEYDVGTSEYIGIPGSVPPAVGTEPDAEALFRNGLAVGPGYEGAQPVVEVTAKA